MLCLRRANLAVALVALVSAGTAAAGSAKGATPVWTELRAEEPAPAPSGLPNLSALVKKASPAVASIIVEEPPPVDLAPSDPLHDFFERYYGDEPTEGLGTGFVIHSSGLVLTNAHVVENAGKIRIVLEDEGFPHEYDAKVVGKDTETDLALLRIKANHPLPVLPLGDSDAVEIADWVVAIGNPFGLAQSVTFGIVSQTGRTDITPQGREGYFDFIQTDASINPGNSGGPLINLRGEVVAINNAINASGQGIGFAVPINMAKKVIPQLAQEGKVTRAWMGLSIQDVTLDYAKSLGMPRPRGVVVSEITDNGPAADAGLEVGDVIIGFGGRPVRGAHHLRWDVACGSIGQKVAVDFVRNGKPMSATVKLRKQPNHEPEGTGPVEIDKLGFVADEPDAASTLVAGTPVGAGVVEVQKGSVAEKAGLKPGDMIVGLGEEPVLSARKLAGLLKAAPAGTLLELHVRRDGENVYVPLRIP